MPKSTIAELSDKCMFSFTKNCQTVFQSAVPFHISDKVPKIQFLYILLFTIITIFILGIPIDV